MSRWKENNFDPSSSKVVAKMDVEGAEYVVLPHMLRHHTICLIDLVMMEWHHEVVAQLHAQYDNLQMDAIKKFKRNRTECVNKEIITFDDETHKDTVGNFVMPTLLKRRLFCGLFNFLC